MKDPKGDLRFVHKLTRIYDFSSLKLTAMACGRQAWGELIILARKGAETQRNWREPQRPTRSRKAFREFIFWSAEKNPLRLRVFAR
jgi:hypothetical protein